MKLLNVFNIIVFINSTYKINRNMLALIYIIDVTFTWFLTFMLLGSK